MRRNLGAALARSQRFAERGPLRAVEGLCGGDLLPAEAEHALRHSVDLVLDAGDCGRLPTTVLDLTGEGPELVRRGKGDVSMLGL